MAIEPRTIHVGPESSLDDLLAEAAGVPLRLEKDGVFYVLKREEETDLWADYDPEAMSEALAKTAGSWADLDIDRAIADLYRWREEGSRPPSRP